MTSYKACPALAALLVLAACERQAAAPAEEAVTAPPEASSDRGEPPATRVNPGPVPVDNEASAPGRRPPPLTDRAERSETGARALLLDFARAIELKRFDQAHDLLSPADQKRWSRTDFAALFEDLGTITVAVPNGTMEGAAGSSYYSAPVTITSTDRQGRPVRIEGEAVLRRVNDVPGATPAQLRWHMEKVTLDRTH